MVRNRTRWASYEQALAGYEVRHISHARDRVREILFPLLGGRRCESGPNHAPIITAVERSVYKSDFDALFIACSADE
jgi:hypothetical protein